MIPRATLVAFAERIAALDPVVDTSSGGCCDSTPELTCGLCGRSTDEFSTSLSIDGAGYDGDVREGKAPFAHRYDCPHLVAKDLVEGVDRLDERRTVEWERQVRLALADCARDVETFTKDWAALLVERDRILATIDPERGRPTSATPRLPQFSGANLYLRAAGTGALYALALFAATSS